MGRIHVRQIRIAILFGAFFSFLYGGCLVPYVATQVLPWLWWWFVVGISHILTFITVRPPAALSWPWSFLFAPSLILGGIWVLYYILIYWGAILSARSGHRNQYYTKVEYDYQYNVYSLVGPSAPPALSQAFAGEQRHQLVEHCYETYRKALARYNPQPIPQLLTPSTFFYRKGNKLTWQLTTDGKLVPILPEELLTPENVRHLLPLLAHHLAWYQTDDFQLRQKFNGYPSEVDSLLPTSFLFLTGNFAWFPTLFKDQQTWNAWLIEQVYAADRFAVWLGQGPALEHILRMFDAETKRRGMVDQSVPTLRSRIGQLEVLNNKERDEMRALGLKPVEPPLVKEENQIPPQLLPGRPPKQENTRPYLWY
jgi:hypothetical protein